MKRSYYRKKRKRKRREQREEDDQDAHVQLGNLDRSYFGEVGVRVCVLLVAKAFASAMFGEVGSFPIRECWTIGEQLS
jgi:hypothetical protein